jgi:VWFA-related protein
MFKQTIVSTILILAILACSAFPQSAILAMRSAPRRTVYVTVLDARSASVSGLGTEHFRVFENGGRRIIKSLVAEPEPISAGFVFDASSSASASLFGKDVDQVGASVIELVKNLPTGSNYFLVGFNDRSATVTDWTVDPNELAAGISKIGALATKKAGPLFDVYLEASKIVASGKHRKRLLIVFTDGRDGGSKQGRKDVLREIESLNIGLYSISLTDGMFGIVDSPEKNFLERVAWISGGQAHFLFSKSLVRPAPGTVPDPDKSEVYRTFERLGIQLANQYVLTYETAIALLGQPVDVNITLADTEEIRKQKGALEIRFRRKLGDSN